MRAAFMAYLIGSMEAVDFYCKAFDAKPRNCFKASDSDDFYAHAEIVIDDKLLLALSESSLYENEFVKERNMQFWLTFEDEQSLEKAYNILREKATIHWELSPCEWCKSLADLTDRYGIRWMLNLF